MCWNERCYISQSYIDNIIRAKTAIYAGISTILHEVGIDERNISKIYIAGRFGKFLNIKKLLTSGCSPIFLKKRSIFLGNTSLTGVILCLLSKSLKEKVEKIAEKNDLHRPFTL